jgi:hypothetical protein
MIPEEQETSTDESTETSEEQQQEKDNGTEQPIDENIKVPEEFQKQCSALIDSCSTVASLDYLQSEISQKRSELMKSTDKPAEFSTSEEPMD